MKKAHIKTELPGPKARELLARDALAVSPSYPRDYPFVMSHGRGAQVWDVDGNPAWCRPSRMQPTNSSISPPITGTKVR